MLYFVSWLTDFAALLFVFAGTRFLAERNASPLLLGVLGASFFLASAVSNALSGRLADSVGRRRVALCGSALFILSLAGVTFFPPASGWYYAAYTSVGVALGLIYPPIMAWLGHRASGRLAQRTYLWFCLAFNSGIVSAQLSGGWMFEHYGPRSPLLAALGLACAGLLCLLLLREPADRHDRPLTLPSPSGRGLGEEGPPPDEAAGVELSRAFTRLNWIANFGGMFSMSMLWFLFPVLVVGLDVQPAVHGMILAVGRIVVMGMYCAMYLFPFWQHRFGLAAAAQVVGVAGLLVIGLASSPFGLACGVAALSALMGYNYFASLLHTDGGNARGRKGRGFGLHEASLGLGAAGGSFFGGLAGADLGSRAPFLIAASVVTVLLAVQSVAWWKLIRPLQAGGRRAGSLSAEGPAVSVEAT